MNPQAKQHSPSSPRLPLTSMANSQRRIAIAVDLSDESAYAVKWAVQNHLRPEDSVFLLHVRPTSALCGADWGFIPQKQTQHSPRKLEDDFDNFTTNKTHTIAQPLVDANIPFKIHIVKDRDMKERLCLEVERLRLSSMIMGSRGIGATRRLVSKGKLGSVSDYCVHHCICPVVVVRYPNDGEGGSPGMKKCGACDEVQLHTVPEEETEEHDGSDHELKGWRFLIYLA